MSWRRHRRRRRALVGLLVVSIAVGCAAPVRVSPRPETPVVVPDGKPGSGLGRLAVETSADPDRGTDGRGQPLWEPYDIYSAEGRFLRRVENSRPRGAETQGSVALAPGRYVVVSEVGVLPARVAVDIRPGLLTRVTEDDLRNAAFAAAR